MQLDVRFERRYVEYRRARSCTREIDEPSLLRPGIHEYVASVEVAMNDTTFPIDLLLGSRDPFLKTIPRRTRTAVLVPDIYELLLRSIDMRVQNFDVL